MHKNANLCFRKQMKCFFECFAIVNLTLGGVTFFKFDSFLMCANKSSVYVHWQLCVVHRPTVRSEGKVISEMNEQRCMTKKGVAAQHLHQRNCF